jgi:hypothetical protein
VALAAADAVLVVVAEGVEVWVAVAKAISVGCWVGLDPVVGIMPENHWRMAG